LMLSFNCNLKFVLYLGIRAERGLSCNQLLAACCLESQPQLCLLLPCLFPTIANIQLLTWGRLL
jgi:hypothetical protein